MAATIFRTKILVFKIRSEYHIYVNFRSTNNDFSLFLRISVLFKQETLQSEPVEFLDPNKLSSDGTIALQGKAFSEDGNLLAYGLSESGSDWIKIKIRDVQTGDDFPDVLTKVKFSSMSWTHDNKGLFYCVSNSLAIFRFHINLM